LYGFDNLEATGCSRRTFSVPLAGGPPQPAQTGHPSFPREEPGF
jgi:hypothetical protein